MSEIGEMWAEHREASIAKRAANRATSADTLRGKGVCFSDHNNGAHLVITGVGATRLPNTIDFWPGTGLWMVRNTRTKRRGVAQLLAEINRLTQPNYHNTIVTQSQEETKCQSKEQLSKRV